MRALITGASGFAGGWLCRACLEAGDEVLGVSRSGTAPEGASAAALDLRNADAVAACVRSFAPEVVYHVAALSSVGRSWTEPARTLEANVGGAVALLEAIRRHAPGARVVWVSSSEVYGTVAEGPIAETVACRPESPYAVSKLAAEQLAEVYARAHGLRVVVVRPFSHSGPGQRPIFLLSNIAWQAVSARRRGERTLRVATGNADVRRDVTDVRDVVRAYRLLAVGDHEGVVNVCSGVTRSTAEQVAALAGQVPDLAVEHVVDPGLVRASEVMELRGDSSRLRSATGWRPEIPYERTVADTIAFWEATLPGR
ncbi:MAG TPA: GDP-mannose 4,6-dehydratase [Solirubrobacteraceae bacterium]|nr:GDP-mannose 4,6-dehydratase [Solirubrobacteraceae bacterium]